ncbi:MULTISPECIES: YceI family protein [unclassified Streptomyces]|uniref:YceI family protein n=1 Tax=unclassified Streptomyces TaxID=2593676 RepID=UPI003666F993
MSDTTSNSTSSVPLSDVEPGRWVLDPARTTVRFENRTMWGLVNVKGVFTKVSGEGEVLAAGGAHGSVTIDAASLDTKNAKRDKHLRSADFFDVETHPTLVFTATGATPTAEGTAQVTGELTVRGVNRALSFVAAASEASADAVTLTAEIPVDRKDFGMTWNQANMLKPLTSVTIVARFTRQAS